MRSYYYYLLQSNNYYGRGVFVSGKDRQHYLLACNAWRVIAQICARIILLCCVVSRARGLIALHALTSQIAPMNIICIVSRSGAMVLFLKDCVCGRDRSVAPNPLIWSHSRLLCLEMSSGSGFEDALTRFLDHFEEISNCADEDVFLKEFVVSDRMCSCELTNHLRTLCQRKTCCANGGDSLWKYVWIIMWSRPSLWQHAGM